MKKSEKLNLGCGSDIKKGFINLDFGNLKDIDANHDLNKFPYPFNDNTYKYIYTKNCLEQLFDMRKVFNELHRISKKDAILDVIVYHFSSVMAFYFHHKTFFNVDSLNTLRDKFEVLENKIILSDKRNFLIKILERWINKHKQFYEKTILKNIIPAYQIHFKLKVKK